MRLEEILIKYKYNDSLSYALKTMYKFVLESRNESLKMQFLKCLDRTEIVLTNDIGDEIAKLYDVPLASKFFLSRAKGQYFIMPEILNGEIKRKVFVRVADPKSLTSVEQESLFHEVIHLLRSYGLGEILYNESVFKIISGVMKKSVPIVDNKLDMNNLKIRNERLEERFVIFFSKYFDFISLSPNYIDMTMNLVMSEMDSLEIPQDDVYELYLNMLIIKYFYDGRASNCLLPEYANFIEEAKKRYDIDIVKKFIEVYQSRYNNKRELVELATALEELKNIGSRIV